MSLLDRRLYRMQRLMWAATVHSASGVGDDEIERRRQGYVEVLFAWNDRLNTNLSVIGSYFGDDARTYLDGLYEDFAHVGRKSRRLCVLLGPGRTLLTSWIELPPNLRVVRRAP